MNTLNLLNLSSCDTDEEYYVIKLHKASKCSNTRNVENIIIEVAGDVDFNILGTTLLLFPCLKSLKIIQTYTRNNCIDFIRFLELLDLEQFVLSDLQSVFLKDIDQDYLFQKLPDNCNYTIVCRPNNSDSTTHINPAKNKYMVFVR